MDSEIRTIQKNLRLFIPLSLEDKLRFKLKSVPSPFFFLREKQSPSEYLDLIAKIKSRARKYNGSKYQVLKAAFGESAHLVIRHSYRPHSWYVNRTITERCWVYSYLGIKFCFYMDSSKYPVYTLNFDKDTTLEEVRTVIKFISNRIDD